ncbi:SIR2 family NAD-dependent protein deacylase [Thermophilibacter mediterraneus]|uniref:SIR2 family NAD-dependent protein deacylase n=1 Tax=Thermophilibacter mediterraneus TaxID=1871031 RepID=UPI003207D6D4
MFDLGSLVAAPREGLTETQLERLACALDEPDAVVVGAGAGLSTAAGLTYSDPRFEAIFGDFIEKYRFQDMYSGGFCPFGSFEERWAYRSRYIWCNRYVKAPGTAYDDLLSLVRDKDHFVLTTNVDHQFQLAGFDGRRLFYTQGGYGLLQCSVPCHRQTYDNERLVRDMIEAQGYVIAADGALTLLEGARPAMSVPSELVPRCPMCGRPMAMNLRSDDTFVEDEGWHAAAARYQDFQRRHQRGRVLSSPLRRRRGWYACRCRPSDSCAVPYA